MLGRSHQTEIPEAAGYSQILLGLLLPDGSPITLVRAPSTNTIRVHLADLRELVTAPYDAQLSALTSPRTTRTISRYLLDQLGLAGTQIRTNDAGRTRLLNLRDLAHLALVTESRIVDPTPPVLHSARPAGKTAAKSVAKFVFTGQDEPLVAGPNAAQRRVHKGKITLLDQLVLDLHGKLTSDQPPTELRARLTVINTTIESQAVSLRGHVDAHRRLVDIRTHLTQDTAAGQARLGEVSDLLARFVLLSRQYESDLERLDMVAEVGSLLGFFRSGPCPFCGAAPEHQHPGHEQQETGRLHHAVDVETTKTRDLLADLLVTITDLDAQKNELTEQLASLERQGAELDSRITAEEAELAPMHEQMDELLAARSTVERDLELHQRIEELEEVRADLDTPNTLPTPRPSNHIPTRILGDFDQILQRTLDAWRVPGVAHAEYDQYNAEVRAGGRPRASRGMGVRSVLHSAFSTSLARYCIERDLPHLGFVVLDSPVVTYREPLDEDVRITGRMVDHFYHDLLDFPGQAIIIENGDPPQDLIDAGYCHEFTGGRSQGRYGFFPTPGSL